MLDLYGTELWHSLHHIPTPEVMKTNCLTRPCWQEKKLTKIIRNYFSKSYKSTTFQLGYIKRTKKRETLASMQSLWQNNYSFNCWIIVLPDAITFKCLRTDIIIDNLNYKAYLRTFFYTFIKLPCFQVTWHQVQWACQQKCSSFG